MYEEKRKLVKKKYGAFFNTSVAFIFCQVLLLHLYKYMRCMHINAFYNFTLLFLHSEGHMPDTLTRKITNYILPVLDQAYSILSWSYYVVIFVSQHQAQSVIIS